MENELLDSTTDEKWEKMKLTYQLIKQITNDFDNERILGSGAFGTVYKGVFRNGEEIAVKVLHNTISGFDGQEFQKEFRNLRELKHENIVRLVGFCNESEKVLAMYEGEQVVALEMHTALCFESVAALEIYECTGLDWHTRYRIIKGICEGLKYLRVGSDSCVWHLDLKPGNILLNDKMIPKIADFGLSRLLGEEKTRKTINRCGTWGYCPPEYINHQVISEHFDIFSLGVILVKIMIGSEGYTRIADMTSGKFVKHVHECWRNKLKQISRPGSLEVYCNQVKRCIEIALECLKLNRQERPTIQSIVSSLNETESMIGDRGLQIQKFDGAGEPVPYSMRIITSGNSSGVEDQAIKPSYNENLESPPEMTFSLLEHITSDFFDKQLIARGEAGRVYKVFYREIFNGQCIAVNYFDPFLLERGTPINEVLRRSLMTHHPNIVKKFGYHEQPRYKCEEYNGELVVVKLLHRVLCSEYMVNQSLKRYISDECSGLDWHLRHGIIKGTCLGLRYLHEELEDPIIHMHLKPSKILLDESLIPKIGDFILSRNEVERTLATEPRVGSLEYMPPEFITKQVISRQYDIYSLGVIIIEIITGNRKYPKSEEMSAKEFIEHVHRRWTNRLQATMSGIAVERYRQQVKKCIEIALKCVEYERLKRPSIGDIVNMLNETETTEMLDVQPPELCFPLDPKKATSCSLHLKNKGDDCVVFMLVAMTPTSYLAKLPLCGVVPPRCTYTITLTTRKQSRSRPQSESVEFIALRSVAVGDYGLQHVGQSSVTAFYDNLFKEAKEIADDEVHEVMLKAVRDPQAEGTAFEAILNSFQVTDEPVHAAKFIARENWVVAGDGNGCILVYSYDEHQEVTSFDAHRTSITCLAVHPTRPFVLSSSHDDYLIKLWDWEKDWECTRTFQGHGVVQMMFNSDEVDSFASASSDGTIKIWSVGCDDSKIITLDGLYVHYFMRRDRQHLITGVKDRTAAQIWNLEMEAGCVEKLEGHTGRITIVHLHPELPLLITGSLDGTVCLWNSTTYKIENKIDFNLGAVYAFGYIKGLRRMVVGCQQGIAMLEIPSP